MSSSDSSLLILLCAIAAIIIVALVIVLFVIYRNAVNPRNLDDRNPSISLPPVQTWRPEQLPQPWSQHEDSLPPVDQKEPYILFGSDNQRRKNSTEQITWGDPNNSLSKKYAQGNCPICRTALGSGKTATCGTCGAIYHLLCWDTYGSICQLCKKS